MGFSKRRLGFTWRRLNSSFWFVPALLTAASLLLFGIAWFSPLA